CGFRNVGLSNSFTVTSDLSIGGHTFGVRAVDSLDRSGPKASLDFDIIAPPITPTPEAEPTPVPEPITQLEETLIPALEATPVPEITPEPAPAIATPAPPPTYPETRQVVDLPSLQQVSLAATGTDDKGNPVAATGEPIRITRLPGDVSIISLPMAVATGSYLDSFADPATGVSIERVEGKTIISIPVRDARGESQLTLTIIVDRLMGTDTAAEAIVRRIDIETAETALDLSSADPELGTVAASLSSQLTRIPDTASISITLTRAPPPEALDAFVRVVREKGSAIAEIAFSISVQKSNLRDGVDLVQSFVNMKVARAWVERVGLPNVRILRLADGGTSELLQTSFLGFDDRGRVVFRGFSPRGLSVFALAALEAPPRGTEEALVEPFGSVKLTSPEGDIVVLLPENPRSEPIYLRLTPLSIAVAPASAPEGFGIVGKVFILEALDNDLRPAEDLVFDIPAQIVLFYTPEELEAAGAEESRLVVGQFRPGEGEWKLLHTTQDPHQKRVIASVERLSYFALLARGATTPVVPLAETGGLVPGTKLLISALVAGLVGVAAGTFLLRRSSALRSP
ncbi:MAG: hypothetical protein V3U26_02120, partial [Dehalococcoidia bacterium]